MTKRYKLIKDLPFQKADDTEWEIEETSADTYTYFSNGEKRLVWYASWGPPLESGFFEEIKPTR